MEILHFYNLTQPYRRLKSYQDNANICVQICKIDIFCTVKRSMLYVYNLVVCDENYWVPCSSVACLIVHGFTMGATVENFAVKPFPGQPIRANFPEAEQGDIHRSWLFH